ncbi:WXG100 family type VII secretion target [Janibacter anophelis]|uniref:WXG100 family type VII secretion target n=1 Tax=Janibacter anophelis TaxID=319054 RepID=UPI000DEF65C4|nr:WXG100 family type VII secretion target [Janibacter anophelis]
MSVQQGLDPQQITAIAERLTAQSEQLQQITQSGSMMLSVLGESWAGHDLEAFSTSWQHVGPQLDAAGTSLRAAAKALHQQAQDQQQASGQTAASGSGGSTVPGTGGPGGTGGRGQGNPWNGVTDFGKNLLVPDDRMIDTAKKIADHTQDGVREGLDRAREGMDWLEDRADQARDWGQEKAERVAAKTADFMLTGEAARFGGGLGILLEASWLLNDGRGEAAAVVDLDPSQRVRDAHGNTHPPVARPTSLEEIMLGTTAAYKNDANVRITTIEHADGTKAYIVHTPGTQTFTAGMGSNPLDSFGNFATVHGGSSASTEAVWDAMEKAGIPPGAPVLMAGHSQGGMINQSLMADPRFTSRFNVTHAMTYGSPVESIPDTSGARQLHLQHAGDLVPKVDFGNAPQPSLLRDSSDVVTLENPEGVWDPQPVKNYGLGQPLMRPGESLGTEIKGAHDHEDYAKSVASAKDPRIDSFEGDLDNFIVQPNDGSKVSGVDIEIRRK